MITMLPLLLLLLVSPESQVNQCLGIPRFASLDDKN